MALAHAAGSATELGQALQLLGEVAGSEGQYSEARELLEQCRDLARSTENAASTLRPK
jgi:hypothetical protein